MHAVYKNRYVLDFIATVMFFTRIPINWAYFSDKPPDLTRAAWAFPMIGYLIGLSCGVIGDLCLFLGLSTFLSCVIAIALSVIVSGAFHEDGLADMADGFGAGGSPERIDKIMHDSRLGTYGVVALTLGLLARIGLAVNLVDLGYSLVFVLSAGFASGKLAIICTRNFFNPSKFAKTGSIIGFISTKNFLAAILIWLVPVMFIFPFFCVLVGITFVTGIICIVGSRSNYYLGGITGDVMGAIAFVSELLFLLGVNLVITGFGL